MIAFCIYSHSCKKLCENGWMNLQPLFGLLGGCIFSGKRFVYSRAEVFIWKHSMNIVKMPCDNFFIFLYITLHYSTVFFRCFTGWIAWERKFCGTFPLRTFVLGTNESSIIQTKHRRISLALSTALRTINDMRASSFSRWYIVTLKDHRQKIPKKNCYKTIFRKINTK